MIFTFILNIFDFFLVGLINLLPTGGFPPAVASSVAYFVGIINSFSYVVPVPTLFQALAVVIGFDVAVVLWHFLNWIIRKIPGMQ